jgi:hypothetical protein
MKRLSPALSNDDGGSQPALADAPWEYAHASEVFILMIERMDR